MLLPAEVLAEILTFTRSGFYDQDEIFEIVAEELFELDGDDREEVRRQIQLGLDELETEKLTWPDTTDCDRLDIAFRSLSAQGIICLQNAGLTQSDGYDDFRELLRKHPHPETVQGYCFFHAQDLGNR